MTFAAWVAPAAEVNSLTEVGLRGLMTFHRQPEGSVVVVGVPAGPTCVGSSWKGGGSCSPICFRKSGARCPVSVDSSDRISSLAEWGVFGGCGVRGVHSARPDIIF